MTLTELSYYVRRALPFVLLFGLVFLIIFYSFKLYFVYLEANRPDVTYTNPIFGRINRPEVKNATSSAGFNFTLDTIEGVPVTATGSANVYFLPDIPTRFGYREKIYLMAKTFGFDTEVIKHNLVGREATFEDSTKKLTIDVGNFNFKFENNIDIGSLTVGSVTLSKTEILNKVADFLQSTGRYPDELARGTNNIIYLKFDAGLGNFVNVERAIDASAVEIDFYRPSISELPIATPKFFNSHNYVILNFKEGEPNIIRAQMSFFEKSEEQFGVYPLKTGEEAFAKLQAGQGTVVAGQKDLKSVKIKKMFPAYLDPDTYQSYLQPVYVFLGEDDFVSFVPAVRDEFLAN